MLVLFFSPLTSIIGHLYIESGEKALTKYFNFFYGFNYVIGAIFFLGYYAIIDDLIGIFYGPNLEIATGIKMALTINYFVQFLRQSVLLFRDATGTFYYDRWKPLIEGLCNLALSLMLVNLLPEEYKVVGVVISAIVTNVLICHIVEPYVLYKHALKCSPRKYYVQNYLLTVLFVVLLLIFETIQVHINGIWINLLVNGCISVALSMVSVAIVMLSNKDFRYYGMKSVKKVLRLK
jgi:hypothetical protein